MRGGLARQCVEAGLACDAVDAATDSPPARDTASCTPRPTSQLHALPLPFTPSGEELGAKFDIIDIPEDMAEQAASYREKLVELVVELDDAVRGVGVCVGKGFVCVRVC